MDKYEQDPGVFNVDLVDYEPPDRFGAVVCISTLEHVGWDEDPRDPTKVPLAVSHLSSLLLKEGQMLITCPLAYNPDLDALVSNDVLRPARETFLHRTKVGWVQVDKQTALHNARYIGNNRGGNTVWIAEFGAIQPAPNAAALTAMTQSGEAAIQ